MDRKTEIQARLWELRTITDQVQGEYSKLFAEWQELVKKEELAAQEAQKAQEPK